MVEGDCDEVSLSKFKTFYPGLYSTSFFFLNKYPIINYTADFIANYYYIIVACGENYIPFKNMWILTQNKF